MKRAPGFWWRPDAGAAALALWPAAKIWGLSATRRMARPPSYRPPVPVICVGNFVAGGAGKTPTALALAAIARGRGLKPGFVASGYGGSAAGPLLVDPERHGAELVGDEPLLLARSAPTAIGRDRAAAARLLAGTDIDLIIMDDGFQNPYVAKDLSLVCVDAAVGIGNGMVIPAGPLRAPFDLQLRRADAIVIIGEGEAAAPLVAAATPAGRRILRAALKPPRPQDWQKRPILAFAGIGRPEKFFASLAAIGAPVKKTVGFADHHRLTEEEAGTLVADAESGDLRLVTTEKDLVRMAGASGKVAELRSRAEAFPIGLEFENPAAPVEMIEAAMRRFREGSRPA